MAFTFNATAGSATANSYATVEYADDYLGGELYAAEWTALVNSVPASLLKKQQALVKATRALERLEYRGSRSAYTSQRLKHPRNGLLDSDGFLYNSAAIIEPFKDATCMLALHYLQTDPTTLVDDSLRQFKQVHIAGVMNLEMRDALPDEDALPDQVIKLIAPWIMSGGGIVRIRRA